VTDRSVERDHPRDHGQAGAGPAERSHERDQDVGGRREAARQRAVVAKERGIEATASSAPSSKSRRNFASPVRRSFRAELLDEEERPDDRGQDRQRRKRSRRAAAEDDVGRERARQHEPDPMRAIRRTRRDARTRESIPYARIRAPSQRANTWQLTSPSTVPACYLHAGQFR